MGKMCLLILCSSLFPFLSLDELVLFVTGGKEKNIHFSLHWLLCVNCLTCYLILTVILWGIIILIADEEIEVQSGEVICSRSYCS